MPEHSLKMLIIVLGIICGCGPAIAVAEPQPVAEGWEYRWGDSPVNTKGVPDWTLTQQPEQWHAIDFPSNPPGRNGQDQVWYRVTLPAGNWQAPVLYIHRVDLIFQVWMDGENIYQYGRFDNDGRGTFEGWPWHEIPLPDDYQGKTLYFRVFSDFTDIGLWGGVRIMDHAELRLHILESSLEALLAAGFTLLVAVFTLPFFLFRKSRETFSSITLFALCSSIMLVAESQARLLIVPYALAWDYLAAGSYYLLPVALGLMLDQWLGERRPRAISLIWKLHLGYMVGALGLSLSGVVALSSTFPPFDALFCSSLTGMAVVLAPRIRSLTRDQQVLVMACGVFGILLLVDMAVIHGLVPWFRVPLSLGLAIFSLAVVFISLRYYAATQQALQTLTATLEQQVAERTDKAETLLQRERARTKLLAIENDKSQVFVDIIAELQGCVSLNQAFRLLAETMPRLCSPLKGMIYRRVTSGGYERLVYWGYGDAEPELAPVVASLSSLPQPTNLVVGSREGSKAAARHLQGLVSFPVNVQFASRGTVLESLVLLDVNSINGSGYTEYTAARLVSSINLVVERIGVTLSGISLREELQRFSYEDALTGLKNRRYFDQLFAHETAVAIRNGAPLSLLLLDIDHFKRFNDTHGHEAGDQALRTLASVLESRFRGSDIVCRYGGEEFVVVLPGSGVTGAKEGAEQLREALGKEPVILEGRNLGYLTISVGVASWPENTDQPERLLTLADETLYRAKKTGRDCVVVFSAAR